MSRGNLLAIMITCIISLLFIEDMQGQTEIEMKIDSFFNDFQQEKFFHSGLYEESGWITGIAQPIPVFEEEDPGEDRQKAIQTWKAWYDGQKEIK